MRSSSSSSSWPSSRFVVDAPRDGPKPKLDVVGASLVGLGPRRHRAGCPAVEHLGTRGAQGLAHRATRLLAGHLAHRPGRGPALRLRALAAAPRGAWARTRSCISTCCTSRRCAPGSPACCPRTSSSWASSSSCRSTCSWSSASMPSRPASRCSRSRSRCSSPPVSARASACATRCARSSGPGSSRPRSRSCS